jgi:glycosyltransferase involved in cell wall biosynthesis
MPNSDLPKISVVIPALNEAAMLPLCLHALQEQDYLGRVEIIVVDNGSTDDTAAIAQSFGARVVREQKRGIVVARIAGFKAAKSDIIVSTDADTVTPTDWLSNLERVLRDQKYAGVVGAYCLYKPNTPMKRLAQHLIPTIRMFDHLFGGHFAGANFAVRREAYESIGGFNPDFATGEDVDLSYRLRKQGYKLKVAYYICVQTSARRLNEGVWHTIFNYVIRNGFSLIFLHRPYIKDLTNIREEPTEIQEATEEPAIL